MPCAKRSSSRSFPCPRCSTPDVRPAVVAAVVVVASACATPTLSATEYRELLAERSAAYAREAEEIRTSHLFDLERSVDNLVKQLEGEELERAVLAETSRRSSALFASIADAVRRYSADLAALDPPNAVGLAHIEYVAALEVSITGIGAMLDALAAASSFQDIDAAIGGSTFNDTQHRVDVACVGLEQALAELGEPVDLHCREG